MTWIKFNSIVFIKFWQKFHFFFKDWQRFVRKLIFHQAINLRINRLSMEFYLVLGFLFFAKSGRTCISSTDLWMMWYNLTLTFQLNCMRSAYSAHTYNVAIHQPSEWFWVWKKEPQMDGFEMRIVLFTCAVGTRRSMKVTLAVSWAEQSCAPWQHRTWCLIAFLAHVSIAIVWSVSESVFSLVLLFAFSTSICIVSTKNLHTHQRMHTNTQTLRNE